MKQGLPEAVQASRLAEDLSPAQIAGLTGLLTLQACEADEVLSAEGRADSRLFAIVAGSLNIVKSKGSIDQTLLVTLSPRDLVHELGFLDGAPRHASLVAATAAQVLVLERERLESLIDVDARLLYALMCTIVRSVHRVQTTLAVQANELTNYIVKQHGRY
jgi:CRP-like cAMP-binding protein